MGSLYAAISGLQASSRWLDVISNNVSNSNTVGFKYGRVNFQDLVSQGLISASGADNANNLGGINPSQLGLGVTVSSIQNIFSQGAIQTTGNPTDVAIQGSGFFTLKSGNSTLYTRAGNFTFDNQGNLVNPSGALVQGWSLKINRTGAVPVVASVTTQLNTSDPSLVGNVQVPQNLVLGPKATSLNASTAVKDQGVILKGNLDNNTPQNAAPMTAGAPTAAQIAAFTPDATNTAVVYDSLGTAHTITFLWQQMAATPGAAASWQWFAFDTTGGVKPAVANYVGGTNFASGAAGYVASPNNVTFNADGSLASNGTAGITNPDIVLTLTNGAITPQVVSVNLGTPNNGGAVPPTFGLRDGITGDYGNGTFNPTTGVYQPVQTIYTAFTDGYAEGTLTNVAVDQTGGVNATFSNNQTITVAKLALTNFANPAGMQKVGDNEYAQSANSGFPQVGTAGSNGFGVTTGGALEQSNVDLTIELTNMLVAQKMFESNARVITAADSILNTLVNLGR